MRIILNIFLYLFAPFFVGFPILILLEFTNRKIPTVLTALCVFPPFIFYSYAKKSIEALLYNKKKTAEISPYFLCWATESCLLACGLVFFAKEYLIIVGLVKAAVVLIIISLICIILEYLGVTQRVLSKLD